MIILKRGRRGESWATKQTVFICCLSAEQPSKNCKTGRQNKRSDCFDSISGKLRFKPFLSGVVLPRIVLVFFKPTGAEMSYYNRLLFLTPR